MATVADLYRQYLGREPDAGGLSYWTQAVKSGPTKGIDPEEITAFLAAARAAGEEPRYMADVTTRNVVEKGDEGMFSFSQAPGYTPPAREGDREFEGQKYFEADRLKILEQLKAQQAAGMKYTASFTKDTAKILDDLSKRLAAQGVTNLTDLKPIMSGETVRDTGEGQLERVESTQVGLYNSKTGEQLSMKMLTNNEGKGTTNYKATFVNGIPVFTATQAATGLEQIQQDFGPILAIAASAILPGLPIGNGFTLGQYLGMQLGLPEAAAKIVGDALVAGGGTFAATGDAEKAALAALMVGGGEFVQGGALGDAMDYMGLGEYKKTFGVLTSEQVKDMRFLAQDAFQLGQQGIGAAAIQQNLIASGVDPLVAGGIANLAASGADFNTLYNDLVNFTGGENIYTGVDTGPGTGITSTTGSPNLPGIEDGMLTPTPPTVPPIPPVEPPIPPVPPVEPPVPPVEPPVPPVEPPVPPVEPPIPPVEPPIPPVVPPDLTKLVPDWLKKAIQAGLTTLGGTAGGSLGGLLGAGIDYARLKALQEEAEKLGAAQAQRAEAFGQQAQVPFTPYTVTTGAGRSTIGPGTATAVASPAQQAIRDAALQQSLASIQAINPEQAAQTLYGQVEALAAPGREREQLSLQNRLARQGLLGFGTTLPTTGGGARTVNPLFESLLSAQETARAQQALQATQFGTTEAGRLQQLAAGLQQQGQAVTAEERSLLSAAQAAQAAEQANRLANANRLFGAQMSGLALRAPYEQQGLYATGQAITAAAGGAKGLLGLPTQQGNSTTNWKLITDALKQYTGKDFDFSSISSGLDITGESQATKNLIEQLQQYGIF